MKSALPRQNLCSKTVPLRLTEKLETQLRRVADQLGVSREQVLLMSLRRGLDVLAPAVKTPEKGTLGQPAS